MLLGDAVADVEEVPFGVVEEPELGLPREVLAAIGQRAQLWSRGIRARQLPAGPGHREQMAAQVAAVHGGHVHRQQCGTRQRVVPVEEMATVARQRRKRAERGLEARHQLGRVDPAEPIRAGRAQQVHADVRRRRAVRRHVARGGLQVVRRQVLVLRADAAFEEPPGVARDAFEVGAILPWQHGLRVHRPDAAGPPDPQRRSGPQDAQHRGEQR